MSKKIVRFYQRPGKPGGHLQTKKRTMQRGLTLEQAQAHCSDPSTSGKLPASKGGWEWFDGMYEE